jgi:hypothetical protein
MNDAERGNYAERLRAKAERVRRLALSITDEPARIALQRFVEEIEAQIAAAESLVDQQAPISGGKPVPG